jgi:hypothetical protein
MALATDNLILILDAVRTNASNAAPSSADSGKEGQKTQYANLIRYVPSGSYFARLRVRGKPIRKSLNHPVEVQHLLIQEQPGIQRLVLDAGRHLAGRRRMRKKLPQLFRRQIPRANSGLQKAHPAHNPAPIRFPGPDGQRFEPADFLELRLEPRLGIGQQFGLRGGRRVCRQWLRGHKRRKIMVDRRFSQVYAIFMKKDRLQNATSITC